MITPVRFRLFPVPERFSGLITHSPFQADEEDALREEALKRLKALSKIPIIYAHYINRNRALIADALRYIKPLNEGLYRRINGMIAYRLKSDIYDRYEPDETSDTSSDELSLIEKLERRRHWGEILNLDHLKQTLQRHSKMDIYRCRSMSEDAMFLMDYERWCEELNQLMIHYMIVAKPEHARTFINNIPSFTRRVKPKHGG